MLGLGMLLGLKVLGFGMLGLELMNQKADSTAHRV